MKDTELLQLIHKNAVMGIVGLETVRREIPEQELRKAVSHQMQEYCHLVRQSASLLRERGQRPKNPGWGTQMCCHVMSALKIRQHPTASEFAEMILQGNTMGLAAGIRHLREYSGADPRIQGLARHMVEVEEANASQMKKFL